MFKTLKSIWQGLTQKGKIFPHQLAFTLLIPLRNWALSPQQIVQRLHLAPHHRILEVASVAWVITQQNFILPVISNLPEK
ncbi:hypothetical protein [Neisseria sicca]|uniref:hypothetical protein n=1 Tax=Neisseria sicca TaxID=490 RepID=UPI0002D8F49E|nr:hypothetical protein [Neisseria sicca]